MGSSNKSACKTRRFKASHVIRAAAAVMLAAFAIITQTGCGDKGSGGEPVTKSDFCLDTACDISIYDITGREGEEILDGAFKEIRQYEKILSRTVSGSDVDKINKASGKPVKVSEDTYDVLELGLEIGRLSGGRFDITVGRLTDLWDFKSDDPKLPQQQEIDKALETVGYENVKYFFRVFKKTQGITPEQFRSYSSKSDL